MMNAIKRMVLTGAAVMVMMSFAAPAMAEGFSHSPDSAYSPYSSIPGGPGTGNTRGIVPIDRLAGFMDEWF